MHADVVHADDVGMAQAPQHIRFAQQSACKLFLRGEASLPTLRGRLLTGVLHDLHGHVAGRLQLVREIHPSRTAAPDFAA